MKGIKSVNKSEYTLSLSKFGKTIRPTGKDLIKEIISAVGTDLNEYMKSKFMQIKGLGSGDLHHSIDMTFDEKQLGAMIRAMLGYGDKVQLSKVAGYEKRFGISLPMPNMNGPATLSIQPTPIDICDLVFRGHASSKILVLNAEMYGIPSIIASAAGGQILRFVSGMIEIIVREKDVNIKLHQIDDIKDRYSLEIWQKYLQIMLNLQTKGSILEISRDGIKFGKLDVPKFHEDTNRFILQKSIDTIEKLLELIALTGKRFENAISLGEIFREIDHIEMIHSIFFGNCANNESIIDFDFVIPDISMQGEFSIFITFIKLESCIIAFSIPILKADINLRPRVMIEVEPHSKAEIEILPVEKYGQFIRHQEKESARLLLLYRK